MEGQKRASREPTRETRKSDFPFSGVWRNCPSGCDSDRLPENCTLVRLSRHKLLSDSFYLTLSIYFPSPSLSLSHYSSRSREQLRRQLTVNWTPIISRIAVSFRLSPLRFLSFSLFLEFGTRIHVFVSHPHLCFISIAY